MLSYGLALESAPVFIDALLDAMTHNLPCYNDNMASTLIHCEPYITVEQNFDMTLNPPST
jgi:hypothetical protein